MKWILAAFALLVSNSANAEGHTVTPSNIASQPLKIDVHTFCHCDDTVDSFVAVTSDRDTIQAQHGATVIVWGEMADQLGQPLKLAVIGARETVQEGSLLYQFNVHRSTLSRVSFNFMNYHRNPLIIDGFEIKLGEFIGPGRGCEE